MPQYHLDPNITQVNRLPARARRFMPDHVKPLHDGWLFRLFDRPENCGDFYGLSADESGYAPIRVPANWQVEGFGKPIYTNYVYPWPLDGENGVDGLADPWRVPRDNPTGCYRLWFEAHAPVNGERAILRFDGVETAYELYVNGRFVGYAEDSKLASEFDVTDHLVNGRNLVALRVFTYATSSYLEDQDYWYLCGIHRPVALITLPKQHMEDLTVRAVADRHGPGGLLWADVRVARVPGYAGQRVNVRLLNEAGELVAEQTAPVAKQSQYSQYHVPTASTARVEIKLPEVRRWTPEQPTLYTVEVTLFDGDEAVDHEVLPAGFKLVTIEDGILKLNGNRLLVFGVNRHEHAWKHGRAVPEAHMVAEIESMKRMNINAVRTCHYPDSVKWYDLCSKMGILVLCECNLETHGVMGQISHDGAAATAYVERAQRMVAQHKNQACIYGWSLGNESGFGPNHAAMYGYIKEADPTRLCQYEAGNPGKNISDTRGTMYATQAQIMQMLTDPIDNRPVILVEYLYQIRNTGGGMKHFIELTRRYPRFQGGYIWDWQDKALLGKTADGAEYFAHGGDFGESFIEPREPVYMTNNGIVRADLAWKPVCHDVREAYAPLLVERAHADSAWANDAQDNHFVVLNRTQGLMSDDFAVTLTAQDAQGREIHSALVPVPCIGPGGMAELDVASLVEGIAPAPRFLEFVVKALDGREVARRQFAYAYSRAKGLTDAADIAADLPKRQRPATALTVTRTPEGITVSNDRVTASFDARGMLTQLVREGKTLVTAARLTLDRPYSGLDAKPGWGWRSSMDKGRTLDVQYCNALVMTGENAVTLPHASAEHARGETEETSRVSEVTVTCAFAAGHSLQGEASFTVRSEGSVQVRLQGFAAPGVFLPRLGLELTLPDTADTLTYLGYGPHETYRDRLVAARFGQYDMKVADMGFDFAPPSETGGREGVEALQVHLPDASLTVDGVTPFHFDISPYTTKAVQDALHTHELTASPARFLRLDAYHAPIGGDMAWSTALDRNDLPGGKVHTLDVVIR